MSRCVLNLSYGRGKYWLNIVVGQQSVLNKIQIAAKAHERLNS